MAYAEHSYYQAPSRDHQSAQAWRTSAGPPNNAYPQGVHPSNNGHGYSEQGVPDYSQARRGQGQAYADPSPGGYGRVPQATYPQSHNAPYYQGQDGGSHQQWQQTQLQHAVDGGHRRPSRQGAPHQGAPRRGLTPIEMRPNGPHGHRYPEGNRSAAGRGGPSQHTNGPAVGPSRTAAKHQNTPRTRQPALGTRPASPEKLSWDCPFPVFPGAKKKKRDAEAASYDLNDLVSEMTLEEQSRRSKQSSESGSGRARSRGSESSTQGHGRPATRPGSEPRAADPSSPPSNARAPNFSAPNFSARLPYHGPSQVPPTQQQPVLREHRPRPAVAPLDLSAQQPYHRQPQSAPHGGPTSPRRLPQANPPSFGGWHFPGQQGADGRSYSPAGNGARSPAANYSYANLEPPTGRSYTPYSNRSETPLRASPSEAAPDQRQTKPDPSASRQGRQPEANRESVGDLLNTYYEPSPQYHELPAEGSSGPPSEIKHQDQKAEEMPDFDAVDTTQADHRRGMSIYQHLPKSKGEASQRPPPPPRRMGSGSGVEGSQQHPPTFAAQAHRSRSQPDLRSQNRAGQADAATTPLRGAGEVFEMAAEVPSVPPLPSQHRAAYAGRHGSATAATTSYPPPHARYHTAPPQSQSGYARPPPAPGPGSYHQAPHRHQSPSSAAPAHVYPGIPMTFSPAAAPPRPSPTAQASRPQQKPANPDALPPHPTPVRYGLVEQPTIDRAASQPVGQPNRPPPVRQYHNFEQDEVASASNSASVAEAERRQSVPVTHEELAQLQQAIRADPSDQKTQLLFAKKLAEAVEVLAGNDGRADAKTRNKNRERYAVDALRTVKKLVAAGYPDAVFYLADCYGTGRLGLPVEPKQAFGLYQTAARAGHAQSAYRTAVCCEMGDEAVGGAKKDALQAIQWYKRAASFGDTPAMYKMGMILLKGLLGQPKNTREAILWLRRAADQADAENPHALHELSLLHASGNAAENIPQDMAASARLLVAASELGYKFSQFRLGSAYEYGLAGFSIDARKSIRWYSCAAVQAEHHSELALSGWYLTGSDGVLQQSDTEAYLWARRAAQSGLAKAEFAMGYFTEVGIGAPPNLDEAKRWYRKAAVQGFPKARERLEDLLSGNPMAQRERISRSKVDKQHEGDCSLM